MSFNYPVTSKIENKWYTQYLEVIQHIFKSYHSSDDDYYLLKRLTDGALILLPKGSVHNDYKLSGPNHTIPLFQIGDVLKSKVTGQLVVIRNTRIDHVNSIYEYTMASDSVWVPGTWGPEYVEAMIIVERDFTVYNPALPAGSSTASTCTHDWVSYFGLIDSFEFCKKCNQKKID